MYINDVFIVYYVAAAILGLIVGQLIGWLNDRLPENKKVISKEFFTEMKMNFKPHYILMLITTVIYVGLVYKFGIHDTIIGNLDLIKYAILTPLILSAFVIDYRLQIIPNRLNLAIFEIGIIFTFIYGLSEAMGFGDVKLMGALGLYFGLQNIIIITLVSFLIGAVLSIGLLVTKIKKTDEYIPFGPFIVIATFISMYVPFEAMKLILMKVFTLGMYKG